MQKIFKFGINLSFIDDDLDIDKSFIVILDLDENNTTGQNWEIIKQKYIEVFRKFKDAQLDRIYDDELYQVHININEMKLIPIAKDISVYEQVYEYTCYRSTIYELIKEIFPKLQY